MYTIDGKFMEKGLTAWGFLNAIAKSSWECKPNVEVSARIISAFLPHKLELVPDEALAKVAG